MTALVAVAGADASAAYRRRGDSLKLWERPQRLGHGAELLHRWVGKVRIRNRNTRRAGERRVDIRAQQVQSAGGSVLLDEAIQIHRGNLVDIQQAGLQMHADGGVVGSLNQGV